MPSVDQMSQGKIIIQEINLLKNQHFLLLINKVIKILRKKLKLIKIKYHKIMKLIAIKKLLMLIYKRINIKYLLMFRTKNFRSLRVIS